MCRDCCWLPDIYFLVIYTFVHRWNTMNHHRRRRPEIKSKFLVSLRVQNHHKLTFISNHFTSIGSRIFRQFQFIMNCVKSQNSKAAGKVSTKFCLFPLKSFKLYFNFFYFIKSSSWSHFGIGLKEFAVKKIFFDQYIAVNQLLTIYEETFIFKIFN